MIKLSNLSSSFCFCPSLPIIHHSSSMIMYFSWRLHHYHHLNFKRSKTLPPSTGLTKPAFMVRQGVFFSFSLSLLVGRYHAKLNKWVRALLGATDELDDVFGVSNERVVTLSLDPNTKGIKETNFGWNDRTRTEWSNTSH